jgi:hypothetical protein
MLSDAVVAAVRGGQFHIWPVETVDEGIAILTGVEAGTPDADGAYPPDSVNGRVLTGLTRLARSYKAFDKETGTDE